MFTIYIISTITKIEDITSDITLLNYTLLEFYQVFP